MVQGMTFCHEDIFGTEFRFFCLEIIIRELSTLKSLINEQGGYVVFLVLSEYSFIRDFRVLVLCPVRLDHMGSRHIK